MASRARSVPAAVVAAFGVAAFVASVAVAATPAAAQSKGLTAAPVFAHIYDLILNAQFDQVTAELKRACPPAPAVACGTLDVVSLWWQIELDPDSRARDGEFQTKVDAAIQAADAWTHREPRRAEAWFYLGAAYGARVQYRVLRTERLAAARDGKRIKESLEQALAIDPTLEDAHFGIGYYKYLADVVPGVLKMLRWLLFLPGGNRVEGLAEMLQARDRGQIVRGEADYQLHLMYLWYEQQTARALSLVEGLERRYPANPVFTLEMAEIQNVYLHDHPASLATGQRLLQAARDKLVAAPDIAEVRARLVMAREYDALTETDRAIEQAQAIIALQPRAPYAARGQAHLALAQAFDRIGDRAQAVANYQAAITFAGADDYLGIRPRAQVGIARTPDARLATAYRLSLQGWRAVERGALAEAEPLLARALEITPNDPVTLFRRAMLLAARDDRPRALQTFERVLAARPYPIPTIVAETYYEIGKLLERDNQSSRAADMYRRAIAVAGAFQETRTNAQRALARIGAARH